VINKKVIACDLDGTLARSKDKLTPEMAEVICGVLKRHYFAVISGGAFPQFQKQVISQLSLAGDDLQNLYLFPTMGSTCYTYDIATSTWKQLYDEPLPEADRKRIISALEWAIPESGVDVSNAYGALVEDRSTQVTFSGQGQDAPVEVKQVWDPEKTKRMKIVELLKTKIPEFEMSVNAHSSIDITRPGLDKSYAIGKIKELLHVVDDEIVFLGDALFKGGNDAPVKKTDVDFVEVPTPEDTLRFLRQYV
jgi:phosphomannomutase